MQKNLSRFRFIYLTVILFSLGCGSPELKPIPHDGVILAFGDSLTVGVGVTKDKSYPSVLAELTGQTIINAGLSGEERQLKDLNALLMNSISTIQI